MEFYECEVRGFTGGWKPATPLWQNADRSKFRDNDPREEMGCQEGYSWIDNWALDFTHRQNQKGNRDHEG